jgi:hypothetical protein
LDLERDLSRESRRLGDLDLENIIEFLVKYVASTRYLDLDLERDLPPPPPRPPLPSS